MYSSSCSQLIMFHGDTYYKIQIFVCEYQFPVKIYRILWFS